MEMLFRSQEVDVVGGDERDAERTAEMLGFAEKAAIAGG